MYGLNPSSTRPRPNEERVSVRRNPFIVIAFLVVLAAVFPQSGCLSLSGSLTPNQTNLSFGNVAIGSSSNQALTFRNSGTAPSTITRAVASGSGFTVTAPPLPLTLAVGQSTTFMARFAPSAIGSASGSLLITSAQETMPQLTSGSGSATPSIATEQKTIAMAGTGVSAAPSITTQPASQTVTAGQTATFFVTSSGAAPLNYQWSKNGAVITGAISASYATPATATSDSGSQFTVVVSNSAGNVTSNPATLTVTAAAMAPSITTQPANQTVIASQTATFLVVASGTAPLNYQWRKNGTAISGATSSTYTTPVTTTSDSGSQFSVAVSNSTGTVTSNAATLAVTAAAVAPTITTQPASQTVSASQTATFQVTASGTAPLSYQWRKNGAAISGATSASYTIPATATSDSGSQFTVVVSNSAGNVISNATTLTVTAAATAPSFTTQPASQSVTVGQAATFSGTASGTAPLSYQWRKNGTAISGATSSTYTTPAEATSDNASQFTVVVSNLAGNATSNVATLTVIGVTAPATPPAAPTGLTATGGNTQISLTWNTSSGTTSYSVHRSTTSGGPYAQVSTTLSPSFTDIGLNNGTKYFYVVSASDAAGQSGNSSEVSATPPVATTPFGQSGNVGTVFVDGVAYPKTIVGINAAITSVGTGGTVVLPGETITTTACINLTSGLHLIGQGSNAVGVYTTSGTIIENSTTDLFCAPASTPLAGMLLENFNAHSLFGGGHIFNFDDSSAIVQNEIRNVGLIQENPGKAIFLDTSQGPDAGFYGNHIHDFSMYYAANSTVPAINIATTTVNNDKIETFTSTGWNQTAGTYAIWIEDTSGNPGFTVNVSNGTFENPGGGAINYLSLANSTMEDDAVYDLTVIPNNPVFHADRSPTGKAPSYNISFRRIRSTNGSAMEPDLQIHPDSNGSINFLIENSTLNWFDGKVYVGAPLCQVIDSVVTNIENLDCTVIGVL
jgi:hypothetical protein